MVEIRAQRHAWSNNVELMVICPNAYRDGAIAVAEPLRFRRVEPNDVPGTDSILQMTNQAAQMLMDELWRCGLRPTEGTGSAGSLAATQKHLDDMRAIAMGLLKGEL